MTTDLDTFIHYGGRTISKTALIVFDNKEDITLNIKYIGIFTKLKEIVKENRNLFENTILQHPSSK